MKTFRQFLKEAFVDAKKVNGNYIEVFVNPTKDEIEDSITNDVNHNFESIRCFINIQTKEFVIFPGDVMHQDIKSIIIGMGWKNFNSKIFDEISYDCIFDNLTFPLLWGAIEMNADTVKPISFDSDTMSAYGKKEWFKKMLKEDYSFVDRYMPGLSAKITKFLKSYSK